MVSSSFGELTVTRGKDAVRPAAAPVPPMDRRLRMERGTTQALADAATLADAAPAIIRVICETLGWECGACWAVEGAIEADGGSMHCVGTWGQPSAGVDAFLKVTREQKQSRNPGGLIRRTWLGGEPVWLRDVSTDASFRRAPVALQAGLHSAFAFPVRTPGRVAGVLEFFSREIVQPDAELIDCASYIGSQIGQFCQRTDAQEQLRGAQEYLRAAFDDAGAGIAMLGLDGRCVRANHALCRMLGYTQEELQHLDPAAVTPPDEDARDHGFLHTGFESTCWLQAVERRYRRRDGEIIWAAVSINPVLDAAGLPRNYIAVLQDITPHKRSEQLQRLGHAITRCLADSDHTSTAMQAAAGAICLSEGWACGAYWALDAGSQTLQLDCVWSAPECDFEHVFRHASPVAFRRGVGLAGHVWATGEPLWVADVTHDPRLLRKDMVRLAGLHAAFLFPVVAGTETLGVFAFWSQAIRRPDPPLLDAVQAIGSQVGQFLRRKQAEEVLRESEQRFHDHTIELASIGIAHVDEQGRFLHASRWLCDLLGYGRDELMALSLAMLADAQDDHSLDTQRSQLRTGEIASFQVEQRWLRKDGSPVWVQLIVSLKHAPDGEPLCEIAMVQDISARKQSDERIKYLATHDGLTGLPNREMFAQLLGHAIGTARRYERKFGVLFIDLDRFKIVNDTLGHEAGDQLLRIVAARLKEALRGSDVVARLGGDEFVVLVQEADSGADISVVAQNILSAVLKPMTIDNQECRVTASIGVSMFPADAQDEQSLMKNADIAMYLAKQEGKNNFQFYSNDIKSHALEKMTLETALRRAMDQEEFSLQYQAKLDLASGRITGVEALLRWNNPELGSVSPAQFIPLAEETGLIVPIGRWVLRTACAQAAQWQRDGLPPVCMAVNLSPRQFNDPDLLGDIAGTLRDTGMQPELLELEITESMVMQNPDRTVRILQAIKDLGVRLAIDDFGTGYSSLAQLKRFPIDTLKVDRSFVRDLPANPEDKAITEAIIAMGKTLSLTVVAEGVETREQKAFLQSQDCDQMQGYYFSKPVPPEKFAQLLAGHDAAQHAA